MGDEKGTFSDVIDRIMDIEQADYDGELEKEVPQPDPEPEATAESETPTDPVVPDTPEDKPEETSDEGEKAVETEATDPEGETETPSDEDTALPDDDTIVSRDDEGNPITLGELRKGQLRQSDYSRKTAELAEQRRALEATQETERSLAKLLVTDEYAREFAELFPQHVDALLADPEGSLALIQDREKFGEFVKRVNALDSDPTLAEAYVKAQSQQSATEQLNQRVRADEVSQFARSLGELVVEIGKDFEGVDPNAVVGWLMSTAGASQERITEASERNDPLYAYDDFAKLAALIVRPDGESFRLEPSLIRDRFDVEAMRASKLTKEQEAHNEKVEEKLAKDPAAPAPTGEPVGDQPVERPTYKSLDEFLNREGGPLSMG